MKINLNKNDVMGILCEHFNIAHTHGYTPVGGNFTEPDHDEVYWEGNPEIKKEN